MVEWYYRKLIYASVLQHMLLRTSLLLYKEQTLLFYIMNYSGKQLGLCSYSCLSVTNCYISINSSMTAICFLAL